jgi:hypothetical protein
MVKKKLTVYAYFYWSILLRALKSEIIVVLTYVLYKKKISSKLICESFILEMYPYSFNNHRQIMKVL